jgi:hypothetical protein
MRLSVLLLDANSQDFSVAQRSSRLSGSIAEGRVSGAWVGLNTLSISISSVA